MEPLNAPNNHHLSTILLKCSALVLGISGWFFISSLHTKTMWFEVPLCFYNDTITTDIQAPEVVHVQLQARRAHLASIDRAALALHIDASDLHEGKNHVVITREKLFLPDFMSVVNYKPLQCCITKTTC